MVIARIPGTVEALLKPRLRLAIHQPNLFPRLKVLQKLASADVWCVLDSVQYNAREWQNRARIIEFDADNRAFWLSIPVHRWRGQKTLIRETAIVSPLSTERLIKLSLFRAMRHAPYWHVIESLLSNLTPQLAADDIGRLCVDTTCSLLRIAGRQPTIVFATALPVTGKASNLIAMICGHLSAHTYLADSGARNYLQPDHFTSIDVLWQNWREPEGEWPGISSWRDVASINYLARAGPDQFTQHLLSSEFVSDPTWRSLAYERC